MEFGNNVLKQGFLTEGKLSCCCVLSNFCIFSWLRLGLCSSSDGRYSISSSFIRPLFTVITLAQFLFTRSVYLFPGSSLRHSLFFASSPFSCGEPRAFLCYSVFCYARARQEFAFEFHLRNFHLFLVHNLFGMYNCFSL